MREKIAQRYKKNLNYANIYAIFLQKCFISVINALQLLKYDAFCCIFHFFFVTL